MAINWDSLDDLKYQDEASTNRALLKSEPLNSADRAAVLAEAGALVAAARKRAKRQGVMESFLQEFSLSTPEGLALMCLAEALLRTPDEENRDRLIAQAITPADWGKHLGKSESLFVNASTWALMLSGKLVDVDAQAKGDLAGFMTRLAGRLGEPVIRAAVGQAIRIMGEQFVLARDIEKGLARAADEKLVCSFDMLGEGARTVVEAQAYEAAYAAAIETVGEAGDGTGPEAGHGISVKLSALSPRYEALQEDRVWSELYPRLLRLCEQAAAYDLNLTIDAEEADRLVLSLKLLDRLSREAALGEWTGLGLAVQAYQKRGTAAIGALAALSRDTGRRLMVRLVKGAYWDTEIKRAQVMGRPGYPVFTTKPATDLSYLACARTLIGAAPHLFGQFATHNAHSLAAVRRMAAEARVRVEFQRLHGMGEALYGAVRKLDRGLVVRTYAPIGAHEDLLPYLVRRLLENGANTSFVHRLLDEETPVAEVVADPVWQVEAAPGPHPRLPLPVDVYGDRLNSLGVDLTIGKERDRLAAAVQRLTLGAAPSDATPADIDRAFARAATAQQDWDALGGPGRAAILRRAADAIEAHIGPLVALCVGEAGKTFGDAVAEVREAADYCRYYALLAERQFAPGGEVLKGPVGESNRLELHGRGVFACISPWNFPLAIFTGQVTAALAAGNAVLAKPAEQTSRVAAYARDLLHAAGVPKDALILVIGPGETVGAALTAHPNLAGVAFTGGTDTAISINRALAAREGPIVPFIAETGGLNAMFVDTTALREQVIDDVIVSAFGSAGQRCSSLRLLLVPDEIADDLIAGVAGAMAALLVGDPADPATDVGPIIDLPALEALLKHEAKLAVEARIISKLDAPAGGTFFGPVLAEIPSPDYLEREVFGPILHVCRYAPDQLEAIGAAIARKGYRLTLGVHSRLSEFADRVRALVPAGNVYVNRSIIGAVVGVQPFGGEGLSGTGPKAGGPHSLLRYATERAVSVNTAAQGGDPALFDL